jgi:hypothetical protein
VAEIIRNNGLVPYIGDKIRMPQVVQSIDGTLRVLRIIHSALLLSMVLYIFVAERIARIVTHPVQPIDHTFLASIAIVSIVAASTAFVFRIKMIGPALDTLQIAPGDVSSLNRWRAGSIISYALAESIVLFGLALRSVGASLPQSAWFYVAGPLLMLSWWPRRP